MNLRLKGYVTKGLLKEECYVMYVHFLACVCAVYTFLVILNSIQIHQQHLLYPITRSFIATDTRNISTLSLSLSFVKLKTSQTKERINSLKTM